MSRTIYLPVELSMSGFVRAQSEDQIKWLPGHDADLYEYVEVQKRPFILGGRSSTSSGRSGYRSAATDTHEAAYRLRDLTGMDVCHLLPSVEELAHLLRTTARTQVHTTPQGLRFVNRFLLVELGGSGIVLSVSSGTGAMVSDELEQPHTGALERYAREIVPTIAGMFFKRTDRYCRTKHGHVKLYDRLDHLNGMHGVWAGDGHIGRWDFDQPHTSMMLAMMASFGATESKVMRNKTAVSQMRLTGDRMENGRVAMALPHPAPLGTMRYRELESTRVFLAIDTPSAYPPADKVSGLPQVRDQFGAPADQVALVRSVLSRWGLDGTDPVDLFFDLAAAGMSSQTLRRHHGPSASFGSSDLPAASSDSTRSFNWARTLRANLSFYEKGVLDVRLGDQHKEIVNCFPVDGPWASAADFARIRAYEAERETRLRRARPSRWSASGWQGHEVTVRGEKARLQGRDRRGTPRRVRGPGVDWSIQREAREHGEQGHSVPEEALHASIVAALRQADGCLLREYRTEQVSEKAEAAHARRTEIRERQAKIAAQRSNMVDRLLLEDCSRALSDEIRRRDAVLSTEESSLDAELRALDVELAVARQHAGADSSDLSKIVASLRGEYRPGVRDALRRAVRNLVFEVEGERRDSPITWAGDLIIDDERATRGLWKVPFSGRYDPNEVYATSGMAGLVKLLRTGEVMRFTGGRLAQAQRDLAAHVGVPQKRLKSLACNEPELVRLWTSIEFPEPVPGEDPAKVVSVGDLLADPGFVDGFGGVEAARALVRRLTELAASHNDGGWLSPAAMSATSATIRNAAVAAGTLPRKRPPGAANSTVVKGLYSATDKSGQNHRWIFHRGGWPELVPCTFCGGLWCVPTRIREITGYLCLAPGCRRDEAGVVWPEKYNQYLAGVDLLLEAGVNLVLPDDFDPEPRRINKRSVHAIDLLERRRTIDDLTPEEREDLVSSYECGEMVRDLLDRLRITGAVAYEYLHSRGVAQRAPGRRARRDRPELAEPEAS